MIKEERYETIEGDKKVSWAIYNTEDGNAIMSAKYVRKLSSFEKLIIKLKKFININKKCSNK